MRQEQKQLPALLTRFIKESCKEILQAAHKRVGMFPSTLLASLTSILEQIQSAKQGDPLLWGLQTREN